MTPPPVTSDVLKHWHGRIESLLRAVTQEAQDMCSCQSEAADSLMSLADGHGADVLKEIHAAYIDALHLEVR